MQATASFVHTGRGVLRISGDDRVAFLQSLISNDVAKVAAAGAAAGRVVYAALLTAQGRFLHDFMVAGVGDALYLDAEGARLGDLLRRLSLYKLRSRVALADVSADFAVGIVFGAAALAAFGLPGEPGAAIALGRGVIYVDPRLPALGARAILPREELHLLRRAGIGDGKAEDYDSLRLSLGVPDGSRDLPVERALLLENGFDELNGVDWKKGCYVGQELTARMKYRALVRKRLVPVRIEGPMPAAATPVLLGEEEAGEMRSSSGAFGLALLRIDAVEQSVRDGRPLTADQARLVPILPPADATKAAG